MRNIVLFEKDGKVCILGANPELDFDMVVNKDLPKGTSYIVVDIDVEEIPENPDFNNPTGTTPQ